MILVIRQFCGVYGQTINEFVIDSDTFFLMDRQYAEFVLMRFDSLESCKRLESDCSNLILEMETGIINRSRMIDKQNELIGNLNTEISVLNQKIDSYKRTESVSESLRKQLKVEKRRRKLWRNTAVGVGIAGVVSSIYLILR
jgi:hypothetical protein